MAALAAAALSSFALIVVWRATSNLAGLNGDYVPAVGIVSRVGPPERWGACPWSSRLDDGYRLIEVVHPPFVDAGAAGIRWH